MTVDGVNVNLPGARGLFTERIGGNSGGPYATLNLGQGTADDPRSVTGNRLLLAEHIGRSPVFAHQVHGSRVVVLESEQAVERWLGLSGPEAEADGIVTTVPGVAPAVLSADCLPILLAGGGAVAALHAGWRGLAAGIVGEAVRALGRVVPGASLQAAIGPGAGSCCYEVGDEVRDAFDAFGPDVLRGRAVDLKAVARRQLCEAGVTEVNDTGLCTLCAGPGRFFSHRRDEGITGRQAGVVWLS